MANKAVQLSHCPLRLVCVCGGGMCACKRRMSFLTVSHIVPGGRAAQTGLMSFLHLSAFSIHISHWSIVENARRLSSCENSQKKFNPYLNALRLKMTAVVSRRDFESQIKFTSQHLSCTSGAFSSVPAKTEHPPTSFYECFAALRSLT